MQGGPWEDYQKSAPPKATSGPWEDYAQSAPKEQDFSAGTALYRSGIRGKQLQSAAQSGTVQSVPVPPELKTPPTFMDKVRQAAHDSAGGQILRFQKSFLDEVPSLLEGGLKMGAVAVGDPSATTELWQGLADTFSSDAPLSEKLGSVVGLNVPAFKQSIKDKEYPEALGKAAVPITMVAAPIMANPVPRFGKVIPPEVALNAAVPKGPKGVPKAEIITPEATEAVRQTASRMGLSTKEAAKNPVKVVERTLSDFNELHNKYLAPVEQVPEALPQMPQRTLNKILSELDYKDPPAAARIRARQTTMGDINSVRDVINTMIDSSRKAEASGGKPYSAGLVTSLETVGKQMRSPYYARLEALHNLPKGSLSSLKMLEGHILRLKPLVQDMAATVSDAAVAEAARSRPQVLSEGLAKMRGALGNMEQKTSLATKGTGVESENFRLMKNVFRELPKRPSALGAGLPPPSNITLRSTVASQPEVPAFVRARSTQNAPRVRSLVGGDQDIPARPAPPVEPFIPVEASATPAFTRISGGRPVPTAPSMESPSLGRLNLGPSPQPALPYEMVNPVPAGQLPPVPREAIPMPPAPPDRLILKQPPAPATEAPMTVKQAMSVVIRDPKTGRMKRVYISGEPLVRP